MQSAVVLFAVLAVASAGNVVQLTNGFGQVGYPTLGNTVVNSARLGGNFAYTVQQPGYAGLNYGASPVVYTTATGVPTTTVGVKAPVTTQYYTTGYNKVASPVVYTNQVPVSTVVAGTPAGTYKTVAGVSPVAYNTVGNYGGLGYTTGLNYGGLGYTTGLNGYTGYPAGYTGYTTVY